MSSFSKLSFTYKCQCGALVEFQDGDPEDIGSSPACVFNFLQSWRVKCKITLVPFFLGVFTSYLDNGWNVNLCTIENCISIILRSIEHNMRPILRTCTFKELGHALFYYSSQCILLKCPGNFLLGAEETGGGQHAWDSFTVKTLYYKPFREYGFQQLE